MNLVHGARLLETYSVVIFPVRVVAEQVGGSLVGGPGPPGGRRHTRAARRELDTRCGNKCRVGVMSVPAEKGVGSS
jgi:hypothetical protein